MFKSTRTQKADKQSANARSPTAQAHGQLPETEQKPTFHVVQRPLPKNYMHIYCKVISMNTKDKHKTAAKIWLEFKGEPLLGEGGATILKAVKTEKSISKAAKKVGMSYRYVWNYLAKLDKTLQSSVVETHKGGKHGGGTQLTPLGEKLLKEYNRAKDYIEVVLGDEEYWVAAGLKISARNRLKGVVKDVEKGDVIAKVKVEIEAPVVVTALISREAVDDLDIKVGNSIEAVIKATEVMIAKAK